MTHWTVETVQALLKDYDSYSDAYSVIQLASALTWALERIEKLELELDEARKLIYVPGLWRCAKCELQLVSNIICASTGDMAANNSPQQCANGCGPMWRVTERESGNKLIDAMDILRAERDAANARAEKAENELACINILTLL